MFAHNRLGFRLRSYSGVALIIIFLPVRQVISSVTTLPTDDPHGCKKLKTDGIGDCAACINSLPEEASCTRNASEDAEVERAALFKGTGGTKLWNETQFLFVADTINEVHIQLSRNEWQILQGDPGAEDYVVGDVVVAGNKMEQVGIRFKGAAGSLKLCLERVKCEKLSWKFKFNKYDKKKTLAGLKRLMIHAAMHDRSVGMRERLSYSLWREMGVPAPRQNHVRAKLTIDKGTPSEQTYNLGVHVLTEQIDGRFTEAFRSGDGGDGNLFKEAWPGFGHVDAASFRNVLKTNEDTNGGNPDMTRLENLGKELQQVTNDYDLAILMKKYTKAMEWARYWVVDRAVENWDGPINFRLTETPECVALRVNCSQEAHSNHNYHLYQEDDADTSEQKFRIYAWDPDGTWIEDNTLNRELGANSVSERKAWDMPVGTCDECVQCQDYAIKGGTSKQMPAGCFSTVRAFARGLRQHYMDAATEFLQGPFQLCRLLSKLNRWHDALEQYIEQDVADGLYPVTDYCENTGRYTWDNDFYYFRNRIVTDYVSRFRASVSCERGYNSDAWEPLSAATNKPITPMVKLDEWNTGQWLPNWLNKTCDTPTTTSTKTTEAPLTTQGAGIPPITELPAVTEVTGSLRVTVSDPTAFASNAQVKLSVQQAIADSNLGITTPMVEILEISIARRLRRASGEERRLAGDVQINYKITVPADAIAVIPTAASIKTQESYLLNSLSNRLMQNGVGSIVATSVVADGVSTSGSTQECNTKKVTKLTVGVDAVIFLGLLALFICTCLACCGRYVCKKMMRGGFQAIAPSSDS